MITIIFQSEYFQYDVFHIVKAFFSAQKPKRMLDESMGNLVEIYGIGQKPFVFEDVTFGENEKVETKRECKYALNIALYQYLVEVTGKKLDWGILMGIRPTKIAMKKQETGMEGEELIQWLQEHYLMSKEKAVLTTYVANKEKMLLEQLNYKEGYSLYIGIPFCKTRCSYCSFTAYPLVAWEDRLDEYVDALLLEIGAVAKQMKQKSLDTVYIGGGTPTTLSDKQLNRLLEFVETTFDLSKCKEVTVEAGRPDTITRAKLEVLRKYNISRISINPQTMQEKTLSAIGRSHTPGEIVETYSMAREMGFDNINMDLIVGLPGETLEDVEDTLIQISKLAPDSLTIHSLAMKRASKLMETKEQFDPKQDIKGMVELGASYAKKMGLMPYYLYRQKNIAGNFENVGYAKVDKAGIYNILIMEEKQSIIAVGAGATTKIVLPREKDNIVRIENVKNVEEYMTRIDEMIERKEKGLWH